MTQAPSAPRLPVDRPNPFDPPDELLRLQAETPLSRLAFPDGHVGWLVTGHDLIRRVLADPRFSSRQELLKRPFEHPLAPAGGFPPAEPGMFIRMDGERHARYRRLLTGQFTVRRMRGLEPRVQEIIDARLDELAAAGPPADLVPHFALAVPSLVICELLGVSPDDRPRFQEDTAALLRLDVEPETAHRAVADVREFMNDLVTDKIAAPTDDILGGLVRTGELTHEELVNMAFLLLVAGHETTANMLGLGTFALLRHPGQLALLAADPGIVDNAVEELLRYTSIIQFGTVRCALEDVDLDGHRIAEGDNLVVSIPAGNRDPERFADAAALDLTRRTTGHVSFGHGVHQCLGQQLARVEMRLGYASLFRRFPNLRLAVAPEDVRLRTDMVIYGVHELPVAW